MGNGNTPDNYTLKLSLSGLRRGVFILSCPSWPHWRSTSVTATGTPEYVDAGDYLHTCKRSRLIDRVPSGASRTSSWAIPGSLKCWVGKPRFQRLQDHSCTDFFPLDTPSLIPLLFRPYSRRYCPSPDGLYLYHPLFVSVLVANLVANIQWQANGS